MDVNDWIYCNCSGAIQVHLIISWAMKRLIYWCQTHFSFYCPSCSRKSSNVYLRHLAASVSQNSIWFVIYLPYENYKKKKKTRQKTFEHNLKTLFLNHFKIIRNKIIWPGKWLIWTTFVSTGPLHRENKNERLKASGVF